MRLLILLPQGAIDLVLLSGQGWLAARRVMSAMKYSLARVVRNGPEVAHVAIDRPFSVNPARRGVLRRYLSCETKQNYVCNREARLCRGFH